MIRLIIAMCVLTSRKTTGQSFIQQFVSTSAIPTLTLQPPRQVNIQFLTPLPRRFQNPRPSSSQLLRNNGSDGGNFPTSRETQPRRELFIPRSVLVENNVTNQPQLQIITESTSGNINVQNNSDVNDKVDFEARPDFERGEVNVTSSVTPEITLPGITTQRTQLLRNSTSGEKAVTPSLDQRANFDGDRCPTGYIRVNGSTECVQPD